MQTYVMIVEIRDEILRIFEKIQYYSGSVLASLYRRAVGLRAVQLLRCCIKCISVT